MSTRKGYKRIKTHTVIPGAVNGAEKETISHQLETIRLKTEKHNNNKNPKQWKNA